MAQRYQQIGLCFLVNKSGITTFELILDKFFFDIEYKSCVLFIVESQYFASLSQ
jgi:hypothetical protein